MNIKKSTLLLFCSTSLVIGLWISVGLGKYTEIIPNGKLANSLIEQCQKDLPRNQYCTIIAVVEEKTEED